MQFQKFFIFFVLIFLISSCSKKEEKISVIEEKNLEILAIYHSHTHSQAYPSVTDIENAINSGWTDPKYILVSLVEKTRPIIRAYNISSDKVVNEIIIEHDGEAYISPS